MRNITIWMFFWIGFVISLLEPLVFGQSNSYCIDNQTLGRNITVEGELINVSHPCYYGCDADRGVCSSDPTTSAAVPVGIAAAFILFALFILWLTGVIP
jgi:hypothetical protein